MATVPTYQQVENVLIKYGLDPRDRGDVTRFMEAFESDLDSGISAAAQRAAAEKKTQAEAGGEDNKSASALLDAYFDNLKKAKQFDEPAAAREKDRSKMSAAELLDLAFELNKEAK